MIKIECKVVEGALDAQRRKIAIPTRIGYFATLSCMAYFKLITLRTTEV